jgi:hypothetical protein
MKELRVVTKAKIKRAESANLKGIVTNKFYRRLTVKCSEIANCGNTQTVSSNTIKTRYQIGTDKAK